MNNRICMFGIIALLCQLPPGSNASDIPFEGNLAAQEVRDIERGVFVIPETNKAYAHVQSIFAPLLRWRTGVLRVCFWNGDAAMQERVAAIADELTIGLPVRFQWHENAVIATCTGDETEANAPWRNFEVRVSLGPVPELLKPGDDPWAFFAQVGQQTRTGRRATVNLPFQPSQRPDDIRNLTLHEFCHVLGCLHEHQRQLCVKDFDADFIRTKFHLTPDQYRENFLNIPSGHAYGAVTQSAFDPHSVMLYRLTRDMFVKGSNSPCIVDKPASNLSEMDKAGLRSAYAGSTNGIRLKLEDFPRLEHEARQKADLQRSFTNFLRNNLKALDSEGRSHPFVSQAHVVKAESLAAEAEAEADSYVLTREQTALIRRALSYFPAH